MSTLNPDTQATGALPIVTVIDDRARHRTPVLPAPNVIPAWVQLLATVIAVAAGSLGFRTIGNPEPLLVVAGVGIVVAALGVIAAVFTPDIDAAIRARIAEKENV